MERTGTIRGGHTSSESQDIKNHHGTLLDNTADNNNRRRSVAIAHIGNSIQYFNDCPRMLEHMMNQRYDVTQDSCLRGGANVTGLFEKGNGMRNKFATPAALKPDGTYDIGSPTVEALLSSSPPDAEESKWDYVIINDHTQAPVREANKTESIQTFQEKYIPLLDSNNKNATVILLMTAAYKSPAKNSSDLGDFDNFTKSLVDGYAEYATLFSNAKIAPLGLAYQYIREHNQRANDPTTTSEAPSAVVSWEALYAPDDFHPSPHGTYLEACLLYCTITGQEPPEYQVGWWSTARYMQPPTVQPPMPLPTVEEADYLKKVASHLCNIAPAAGATSSL
ncbi:unnamed protein product [Cylindrotheca closterium]|uniref:Ig-like domain-containing protein n=1 Tax=Cylindrotheca closterium TaxID=2856 RepID=A0AAD2JLM4_9STRA|nr:unnamed protein product [Cylindrotheca closterium]